MDKEQKRITLQRKIQSLIQQSLINRYTVDYLIFGIERKPVQKHVLN